MNQEDRVLNMARARTLAASGQARSIRQKARLSQGDVAAVVGVSVSTVCKWEHQQRTPRGDAAARYGAFLDRLHLTHAKPLRDADA